MIRLRHPLLHALPLVLLLTAALPAAAQVGEARGTIALGGNAGVAWNTVDFDPTIKQRAHVGPTFGLTFRLTSEKYFKTLCALQIELNYAQLGWREEVLDAASEPLQEQYERHLSYVQLPLLARLGWGREQKGFMAFVLAGPQVGYCLGSKEERSDFVLDAEGNPSRPNGTVAQYGKALDHRFDYGITGGAGLEWHSPIGHFIVDGRYYYGLSDLFANGKKDDFARSAHGTISVRLTYLVDL